MQEQLMQLSKQYFSVLDDTKSLVFENETSSLS